MLTPDEVTQTTGDLERVPVHIDRKKFINERRQSFLQEKRTDALPPLTGDIGHGRPIWRQLMQLREENKRLQSEIEEQRGEVERLQQELNTVQTTFNNQIGAIHSGHLHDIEQYQESLAEVTAERNQLQEDYFTLQQHYQELAQIHPETIDEEAQKRILQAMETLESSPEETPPWLADIAQMLDIRMRQDEDRELAQAYILKRDLERIAVELEQERKDVANERQRVLALQSSVRQQAKQREQLIKARLRIRSTMRVTGTAAILVVLLVVLQFASIALFHIYVNLPILFTLLVPILVCVGLAPVFASRFSDIKYIYQSAPHQQKRKAS